MAFVIRLQRPHLPFLTLDREAAGVAARKKFYFDPLQLVAEVRKSSQRRQWAKHLRDEAVLDGNTSVRSTADGDVDKLGRLLVGLKITFESNGR
ncbi:hypothetical protein CYMTET_21714 [Cymbomonas tetramitiformis]|uniref:Uncharacterized protein n=1 Tax=Cymbomonas tetramitiformis TaxID=36881 RepID=A0AAE0G1H1_9CHLO|nr:hypothetical protein CYMTET_21714 [Cymbomonas tetramitiformis]